MIGSFFSKLWLSLKSKRYVRYIFTSFFKDFCIWIFAFFVILFALQYIDINDGFDLKHKLYFTTLMSFEKLFESVDVVCLVCSICFILRIKNSFNFLILKSFGITSKQILKPMILFLFFFSLVEMFVLKPIFVELQNIKQAKERQYFETMDIGLKKGNDFVFVDNQNEKDYKIVKGKYESKDDDVVYIYDATISCYKSRVLSDVYVGKKFVVKDNLIYGENVRHLQYVNGFYQNNLIDKFSISTDFNRKALIHEIKNSSKLQHSTTLGIYDHLKFLSGNDIKRKMTTEAIFSAREFLAIEFSNVFLILLCVLLAFLFCAPNDRNANGIKLAFKCFIIYFILLRIHHQVSYISGYSFWSSVCFCFLSAISCYFVYLLIINKDWCDTLIDMGEIKKRFLTRLFKK